jgi:hypothetical protein
MTNPWWYSGDDEPAGERSAPQWDPTGLVAAANQLVDWATERFVTPHAEHADPADYPNCVLCRGSTVLGTIARPATTEPVEPITWIPVRRQAGH